MNLGSFHVVFGAPGPCACGDVAQYPALTGMATSTWQVRAARVLAAASKAVASL